MPERNPVGFAELRAFCRSDDAEACEFDRALSRLALGGAERFSDSCTVAISTHAIALVFGAFA